MQSAASTRATRRAAPRAGARGAARTTVSGVTATRAPLRRRVAARAEPDAAPSAAAAVTYADESVFYEGSGSPAELALSIALGFTLICLPLTLASIGRRLWISYKFTDRRVVVTTASPVLQREVQVAYDQIKEMRTIQRGLGLWSDAVIFLKDGARLEIAGLERGMEIRDYVMGKVTAAEDGEM